MKTPTRIGRYDVERLLGQGGMGRVWLARDTVLGRRVAIKVLRDDLSLPPRVVDELVERMRHEARAVAAVSHPHIVTLHDMGEDEGVGLYLVFEYVPGPERDEPVSLRDRLRDGPLPLADVATLATQLGQALAFAHEAGVVHRDIKPENVLFSRTGAKIADFGVARIPDSNITRTNTVLGTPAYTAPEALNDGTFGPASDQFALAATLYEAAGAVRAFDGPDPIRTAGKVTSEPPPPLTRRIGETAAVRALDDVLARGMAKIPEDRFASAAELGAAVTRSVTVIPTPPASAARTSERLPIATDYDGERPPLSSRMAIAQRMSERPQAAIPAAESRPSLYARKKTARSQNIAVGISLIVLIALAIHGRRRDATRDDAPNSPSASTAPKATPPTPHAHPRPAASLPDAGE